MMWAWMNGEYLRAEDIRISPYDHGFLYGLGFFETFRTYDGHVFLLDSHIERLCAALDDFRIAVDFEALDIPAIVSELNKRSGGTDGYFRLNVSAGVHDIGLAPSAYENPTVIVFRKPLPPLERGKEKSAVWLDTLRNSPESGVRHKSHHYANNVRARLELPSLAQQEGFFLNEQGHIAEGITSNIFWAAGGELYTPSLDTGILSGITRQWILKEAREIGLKVHEGLFGADLLEKADEVFVTNAVQELVPISNVGSVVFAGKEGRVYMRLHERYAEQADHQSGE